jgi:uncharacterized protein (TIGR02996 family)
MTESADELGFLKTIADQTDEEATRLVYADWGSRHRATIAQTSSASFGRESIRFRPNHHDHRRSMRSGSRSTSCCTSR